MLDMKNVKFSKIKQSIVASIFLLISGFLSSCTDSAPNVFAGNRTGITCLAPDDFGFTKVSVDSFGYNVPKNPNNQYSEWMKIDTVYNGGQLALYAYGPSYISTSAWFPFLGNSYSFSSLMSTQDPGSSNPPVNLYPQCVGNSPNNQPDLNIYSSSDGPGCTTSSTKPSQIQCPHLLTCDYCVPKSSDAPYIQLQNVVTIDGQILSPTISYSGDTQVNTRRFSCFFTQGAGAYLLTVPSDGNGNPITDPNMDAKHARDYKLIDGATATNLYPPSNGGSLFNTNGVSVGGYQGDLSQGSRAKFGDLLYVKILDNYYNDNIGSMELDIKSGDTKIGPIQRFLTFIIDKLKTFTSSIFIRLVENEQYILMVRLTMTLYIMTTGLLFSAGILQITQKEMLIRVFKLVLVTALLTGGNSWTFFNNYFFNLFTSGYIEFTNIVTGVFTGISSKGDPVGTLTFFDKLLFLFFSPETTFKIWSLLFHKFVGIYMIPLIYAGIFVFVRVIAETAVYYIMTYMVICLLITMGPIFIVFILFGKTKAIFDNWINQLVSYVIQGVFYISALTMMTIIILTEFYKVIGYRTCWVNIFKVLGQDIFNFFIPCYEGSNCPSYLPMVPSTKREMVISLPGWSYTQNSDNTYTFNQPYTATGCRNIDFPFLDPGLTVSNCAGGIPSGQTSAALTDSNLLSDLAAGSFGGIAHIGETLIFILVTVIGMKFMEIVPQMAKAISGTQGSVADIKGASHQAFQQMTSAPGKVLSAAKQVARKPLQALGKATGVTKLAGKVSSQLKKLDEKLSGKKATGLVGKFGGKAYSSIKFLALMPGRALSSAVRGKLHSKLKDNYVTKGLRGVQNTIQGGLTKAKHKVKDKFTPKFIKENQAAIRDFDRKWDKLVKKAQAPLAKPFDAAMNKINKLQETVNFTRANFRSRDSLAEIRDYYKRQDKPNALENNPNAIINYLKEQDNSEGRAIQAFIGAIDRQKGMSAVQSGVKDEQDDPNSKFRDCWTKNIDTGQQEFDYMKAMNVYANDIHADQSMIPEALRPYVEIQKPDMKAMDAANLDFADKHRASVDASAAQLQATREFDEARRAGDAAQIAAAEQALTASRQSAETAFAASTASQGKMLAEARNFAAEQAKYEILKENIAGTSRSGIPMAPRTEQLTLSQHTSNAATILASGADQDYSKAWNAYQAAPADPATSAGLYVASSKAAVYRQEADKANAAYIQAQTSDAIAQEKYKMLTDVYSRKQAKKDHDY